MHKKHFSLAALSLFMTGAVMAQKPGNPSPFVFRDYIMGTVLQKNGGTVNAVLNYNTFTQEMMFENDGQRLVLDDPGNIDTVYMQGRKFIPSKGYYLEKVTNTPVALFVQHINKGVYESGKRAEANSVLSDNYQKREVKTIDPYALRLPDNFRLQSESKFWIQKGTKFVQLTSLKKLVDQFPGKSDKIEAFVKSENIRFTEQDDLVKLVNFCNN